MAKVKDVVSYLNSVADPSLQESYDNSGLLVGDQSQDVTGVLISLDCTEDIVQEAIAKNCNLIVSHHPIVFRGLKRLTGSNYVERTVMKAIKHDIALYAIHTNLDNVMDGVNGKIAQKLGLSNTRILVPKAELMSKLVTFVPKESTASLIEALSETGSGVIGDYDHCSFRVSGKGTFRGNEQSNPAIGSAGKFEEVEEERLEVILPKYLTSNILNKLKGIHPYEEPAYYLSDITNTDVRFGSGIVGKLDSPIESEKFLAYLKEKMGLNVIRHTNIVKDTISKVAVCGGSGSFLLKKAISASADVFITGDFKYHEFFDAEDKIMICDIGHYESEVYTKDLIYDLLTQEFNNFALNLSESNTNPVNYYY